MKLQLPKSSNGTVLKTGGMSSQSLPGSSSSISNSNLAATASRGERPSPAGIKSINANNSKDEEVKKSENVDVSDFEKLTNISNKRPEIISILNFQPLLETTTGGPTPEGELFDVFVESMRKLDEASAAATQNSEILSANFVKNNNEKFKSEVTEVRNLLQTIYEIFRTFLTIKKSLNITDEDYDYTPTKFINKNFNNNLLDKGIINKYASELPDNLNIKTTLEMLRGPSSDPLVEKYSATKLWIMLLNECRTLHAYHSYKLLKSSDVVKGVFSNNAKNNIENALADLKTTSTISPYKTKRFSFSNSSINSQTVGDTHSSVESFELLLKNELSVFEDITKITAIFHSVTREIILSKNYSESKLGIFKSGVAAFPNQKKPLNIARSIFGMKQGNVWLEGIDEGDKSSLLGLTYYQQDSEVAGPTPDSSKKVLMFEQRKKPGFSSAFDAAGEYFFDRPDQFIQLVTKKSVGQTSNTLATDVALKARIENLTKLSSKYDEDFFKFLSEISGLPLNNDTFFDKSKPIFFSADSVKFFENVWNSIKNLIPSPPANITGIRNRQLGIKALLSCCGNGKENSSAIKNFVFLVLMSRVDDVQFSIKKAGELSSGADTDVYVTNFFVQLENYSVVEPIISILGVDNFISEFDDIKDDIDLTAGNANIDKQHAKAEEFVSKVVEQTNERNVHISQYASVDTLISALTNNDIFKKIVTVLKDIKKTCIDYATASNPQAKKTNYSEIDVNSILYCAFDAICKLIYSTSGLDILGVKIDTVLGESATLYNDEMTDQEKEVLAEKGIGLSKFCMFISRTSDSDLSYNQVKKQLAEENRLLLAGFSTVGNVLSNLNLRLQEAKNLTDKLDIKTYQKLIKYLGDPNKLAFFLKEPQLTLALSNFEDVYQSFQSFSEKVDESADNSKILFTNYYNRLSHSSEIVRLLKSFLADSEFKSIKGYNKKIISVGLAQDLLKNTLPAAEVGKENDIIKLSIYKIDLLNSNIIYKPKTYLFEASRYPARIYEEFKKDINSLSAIPTRNYSFSEAISKTNSGFSAYWDKNTTNIFGSEYSFLKNKEKLEILENHAVSFLLENYIKILTGMQINEAAFNLSTEESEALLHDFEMSFNAQTLKNGLLSVENNPLFEIKNQNNPFSTSKKTKLKNLKSAAVFNKQFVDKIVSAATKSDFADVSTYIKFLIQPKKFDRVFHIIFDPEFRVDEEKTSQLMNRYPTFLEDLAKSGRLNTIRYADSTTAYFDPDKSSSDVSLETFFVVLESFIKDKNSDA